MGTSSKTCKPELKIVLVEPNFYFLLFLPKADSVSSGLPQTLFT